MCVLDQRERIGGSSEGFAGDKSVESSHGGSESGITGGEIWRRGTSARGGDIVRSGRFGAREGSGARVGGDPTGEISRVKRRCLHFRQRKICIANGRVGQVV